jgi:hypothetical protein
MASAGGRPGDLPVSEQLSREVLCLPLYPELPLGDVARVAARCGLPRPPGPGPDAQPWRPSETLQSAQLRRGGVADLEVAALPQQLLEVLDVAVPPHLAREDLPDVAVTGEGLEPLRVADPLGRLLADEEVPGAADHGHEVVVVVVVGRKRLDPEDEVVVGRASQPTSPGGGRGRPAVEGRGDRSTR